jgi:hypothetical protein
MKSFIYWSSLFILLITCVEFERQIYYQIISTSMGTTCAPLLVDIFLYSYDEEFIQKLIKDKPEALKSMHRSPGYKKKQLVLCKNDVLQW